MKTNIAYRIADAMAEMTVLRIVAAVLAVMSLTIAVCEIRLSHSAAFTLATGTTASLLAVIAAAAAVGKTFWISCVTLFWRKRLYAGIAVAVLFGLIAHTYSIQALLSLASTGRDTVVSERGHQIEARERVVEQYELAKKTVTAMAGQRASAAVANDLRLAEADLAAAKQAKVSADTEAETQKATGIGRLYNAAVTDSRAAATKIDTIESRIRTLNSEKRASLQAEQAKVEMDENRAKLEAMGAPGVKDPQASNIRDYLSLVGWNVSERGVSLGTLLPILAIAELGGMLLMALSTSLWIAGAPVYVQPSGGQVAELHREPDPAPQPVKALPKPEMTKEQKALTGLTRLIAVERNNTITASGNEIADHLEVARSSMAVYIKKWADEGKITLDREGDRYVIGLPSRALLQARRQMVSA